MLQFHFRLMPVEEILPWGTEQGFPSLSWFGLTYGWFWIDVGGHELFRYTAQVLDHWRGLSLDAPVLPLPYEDYQVARYWEDLLEMLPAILHPLPDDIAARVTDADAWWQWREAARRWQEEHEDEGTWDVYYTAVAWWSERNWDAGHLAYPPRIKIWRVADTVFIRWDNRDIAVEGIPVWEAQTGEVFLSVSEFVVAVESFHQRFLDEMQQRVDAIRATWSRPEIGIDRDALEHGQRERFGWLAPAVHPWTAQVKYDYSWEQVRNAMATIEQEVASSVHPTHAGKA